MKQRKATSKPKPKKTKVDEKLEPVKILVRTKASVCNWDDLEYQIMKGAIE